MADKPMGEMFAQDKYDPDEGKLIGFGDYPPVSPKDFIQDWAPYMSSYQTIAARADPKRFREAIPNMPLSENIDDRRDDPRMGWMGYLYSKAKGRILDRRYINSLNNSREVSPMARDAGYYNIPTAGYSSP